MLRVRLGALVALVSVGVAACSGGGNFIPASHPTPTSSAGAVAGASASPETALTSAGAPVAASANGDTASITVAGSGAVTASLSAAPPTGVPALAIARAAGKTSLATTKRGALDANGNSAIVYVQITANTQSTITGFPATTVTAASVPAGPYYLAYYDNGSWVTISTAGADTSSASSGNSIKFNAVTFTPAILLASGGSGNFCVYAGSVLPSPPPSSAAPTTSPSPSASGSASASPSPSPSASASPSVAPSPSPSAHASASPSPSVAPSPSPSPSVAPSASPSPAASYAPLTANVTGGALAVNETGNATFTVTESGYTGSYTVTSNNTSVISIPNATITATQSSPWNTTITFDALQNSGSTPVNVKVQDSHGQSVTVAVTVTTTPVTIDSHARGSAR